MLGDSTDEAVAGRAAKRLEVRAMPREPFPFSGFECDCGHESHFCEGTVSEMKAMSRKKRVYLADSEKHVLVFEGGRTVGIECPGARKARPRKRLA